MLLDRLGSAGVGLARGDDEFGHVLSPSRGRCGSFTRILLHLTPWKIIGLRAHRGRFPASAPCPAPAVPARPCPGLGQRCWRRSGRRRSRRPSRRSSPPPGCTPTRSANTSTRWCATASPTVTPRRRPAAGGRPGCTRPPAWTPPLPLSTPASPRRWQRRSTGPARHRPTTRSPPEGLGPRARTRARCQAGGQCGRGPTRGGLPARRGRVRTAGRRPQLDGPAHPLPAAGGRPQVPRYRLRRTPRPRPGALEEYGADPDGTELLPFAEPGACRLHLMQRRR